MKASLPVLGSVVAVVALAAGVTYVSSSSGSSEPRPLRLASGGTAAQRDAALSAGSSSSSGYRLTGTLPAGQPDDAPAYTLSGGPADADVVAALAKALDAGTPVRDGKGWRAGGLFVSGDAGQSWWFAPCAKDMPVSDDVRVGCAVATPGGAPVPAPAPAPGVTGGGTAAAPPPPSSAPVRSPAPAPDPMPKDDVRAAVKPVLEAVGLDVSDARVDTWAYGGSATVSRTVGGLEAMGLDTSVQVDAEGHVQGASGFLGSADRGDSYPLITAQDAYDQLPPLARAMLCPVGPDGQGCGQPEPTEVTGAHLGLLLSALTDGGQALVPAWLFEIKGWTAPQPVVAVQEKYLPKPAEPTADPGTPGAVPPAPPVAGGPAREAFSFDKAARGDQPDQLVVTYGDSSTCVHENVTAQAKEDADTVYVVLEADTRDPDVACTEDYKPVERTLRLQAPLADRKVVDASSGKPVPLT
jgi:hypothetical protein